MNKSVVREGNVTKWKSAFYSHLVLNVPLQSLAHINSTRILIIRMEKGASCFHNRKTGEDLNTFSLVCITHNDPVFPKHWITGLLLMAHSCRTTLAHLKVFGPLWMPVLSVSLSRADRLWSRLRYLSNCWTVIITLKAMIPGRWFQMVWVNVETFPSTIIRSHFPMSNTLVHDKYWC